MESFVSMVDSVDGVVSMDIPGWDADANGFILSMEATVTTRRRSQDMQPPQMIILHFCRRTISPSTHAHFIIHQPYQNFIRQAAWDEETRWMLTHVAAGGVPTADLAFLVLAFRRYTRTVLHHFPIAELSTMEFLSVIEIPLVAPDPSISAGRLRYSVPLETHRLFYEGDDDDIEPIRGPTQAPTPAVEGLRMKIAEKPDVCSICLDDFDVATPVLETPCRHIFHDACLREWLARSYTCPLCRFMLQQSSCMSATD